MNLLMMIFALALTLMTLPSQAQDDFFNPGNPANPFSPLNPTSPLNPNNTSSTGGAVPESFTRAIRLMPYREVAFTLKTLSVRGYEDPACSGMGWVKDCNPEFRLQLILCKGRDCVVRSNLMGGWSRVQSPVIRMPSPDSSVGRQELMTVDLHNMDLIEQLSRVVGASGAQDYRIGLRLVEYNYYQANTSIAQKTVTLGEISSSSGEFVIETPDGRVRAEIAWSSRDTLGY